MNGIQKDIRRFLIPALRRASMRFFIKVNKIKVYPRTEALRIARIDRGLYKCASCLGTFGPKEISVDHIVPVVPLDDGIYDWNDYINGLFVETDKLQVLCNPCHDIKSSIEDNLRLSSRKNKQKSKKRLVKKKKV
jgi:5-methylcytosine-specific restriction endonuclease McrA